MQVSVCFKDFIQTEGGEACARTYMCVWVAKFNWALLLVCMCLHMEKEGGDGGEARWEKMVVGFFFPLSGFVMKLRTQQRRRAQWQRRSLCCETVCMNMCD